MAKRQLPTPEQLRQLLRYEPETGRLFWLPRPLSDFSSPRAHAISAARRSGKEAFITRADTGYMVAPIDGLTLYAHRVIWAIVYGNWPNHDIDHINGDRTDNRISNLREATRAQNSLNTSKHSDNASGRKGVHWSRSRQRWVAEITLNGTKTFLGRFKDIDAASSAYEDAAKRMFGDFARSS
jgi:hypothetical protein